MQNFDFNQQERELRAFDSAFYSRLYVASPLLAWTVANVINIELETRVLCESEDAWDAFRKLKTREIARRIGIPLQILRKIPVSNLGSPALTEEMAMLRRVLKKKPKCGRFLRHAKTVNLPVVRAMYIIDSDDAHMWAWLSELPASTVGWITDHLGVIHNIMRATGRTWQNGMIRDEVSLAKVYEKMMAVNLPEPPFTDEPNAIVAIRSGTELLSWGLKQRNCIESYTASCISGTKFVYKMIWPSAGTLMVSCIYGEKPWLVDARATANAEMDKDQVAVTLDWCQKNGISTKYWIEGGAL